MDKPETHEQISVREYQRDNQEWTNQRHWQHCVHKTRDEDKQNKKHNTENYKDKQHGPQRNRG